MTIDSGQGEFYAGPENSMLLVYPNDMMDGLFVDLDENYCFIQADTDGFDQLKEQCLSEGIPIGEVGDDADLDKHPHNLVIESLGRFVLDAAEESRTMEMEDRYLPPAENKELSVRDEYGIYVRLGWLPASNTLEIHYIDKRDGDEFRTIVPNDKGNDAFKKPNHYRPYAGEDGA